jgi:hypothetical protein
VNYKRRLFEGQTVRALTEKGGLVPGREYTVTRVLEDDMGHGNFVTYIVKSQREYLQISEGSGLFEVVR